VSPTLLREGPYRFYFYAGDFYAGDGAEPAHVHVEGDGGEANYWLRPVALKNAWDAFFGN
jgi:Domain of unknown function (DUF4160)